MSNDEKDLINSIQWVISIQLEQDRPHTDSRQLYFYSHEGALETFYKIESACRSGIGLVRLCSVQGQYNKHITSIRAKDITSIVLLPRSSCAYLSDI